MLYDFDLYQTHTRLQYSDSKELNEHLFYFENVLLDFILVLIEHVYHYGYCFVNCLFYCLYDIQRTSFLDGMPQGCILRCPYKNGILPPLILNQKLQPWFDYFNVRVVLYLCYLHLDAT